MLKDKQHSKTMTKNELKIKTISNKRTDKLTDRVLLFGQMTEKKEKADPSQNQKSAIFTNALMKTIL
jgi:hypothetical protein